VSEVLLYRLGFSDGEKDEIQKESTLFRLDLYFRKGTILSSFREIF
jgi:hypothetical protein